MTLKQREKIARGESVFTGGLLGLIGISLASAFLSLITLTIATPWLICWQQRWYAEHTWIDGKQTTFDGTGGQLIGKWICWFLLTIITFGIYGFWLPIKVQQWTVKHTHLVEPIVHAPAGGYAIPVIPVAPAAPAAPVAPAPTVAPAAPVEDSIFCGYCGDRRPKGERFCGNCGANMGAPVVAPEPTVKADDSVKPDAIQKPVNPGFNSLGDL